MSGTQFYLISETSAKRYVDHVVRRGPALLSDLAYRMAETGGPIEEMDATAESLVPLWEWFLTQHARGFPGIPSDARYSRALFLGYGPPDRQDRARYFAEPFAHYLFEVIRTYDAAAKWIVDLSHPKTTSFQNPGVKVEGWEWIGAEDLAIDASGAAVRRLPSALERSGLRDLAETRYKLNEHDIRFPASGSILAPLLDAPRVPADDPSRVVPSTLNEEWVSPLPHRKPGTYEAGLADPKADIKRLEDARPLDERLVAVELNRRGWHRDGAPVTPESLLHEETQLILGDEHAVLEVAVSKGRLRMLAIDTINISDAEFEQMEKDLREVAAAVGARYAAREEFDPDLREQD